MEKTEIPHLTYAELNEKASRLENLFYAAYDALVEITGPMDPTVYAHWTARHDSILRLVSVIKKSADDHVAHQSSSSDQLALNLNP